MNIAALFIKRPVMTTLVMLAIVLFGIMAYRQLPVSDLPNVDFPTIQVSASLPGASPETMAASVATPLERQFSTIAGLDSMTSASALGTTNVTLQFTLSRDLDAAAQDVQAAIAAAARQLPPNMPAPPSYSKVNPADTPVIYLALSSDTMPMNQLDEYAETLMAQRISTVSGVAQVQVYGAQKYAVRVQLDPQSLASSGLGVEQVASAVQGANVDLPTGTLYGAHQAFTVQANGQLTDAAAYRPLIVAYKNGSPARLQDLGRVVDSVENDKTAAWFNNQRGVILAVQRQPGTNTVAVTDAIKKLFPSFRQQLPAAVSLDVLFDRSQSIRASVLVSGFVSLTLTPMLCSRFLRPPHEQRHGRFYQASERVFERALGIYSAGLRWSLRHRLTLALGSLAVLVATGWLFTLIPKGFIPDEDTGQIVAFTEAIQGISYESLAAHQQQLAAIFAKDPNVAAFMSSVGSRGSSTGPNNGLFLIRLKPRDQRPPAKAVIEELRPKLSVIPGMRAFLQIPRTIRIGGRLTKSQYQYTLQGSDIRELYRYAPLLEAKMRALPGLRDVTSDLQITNPQVEVDIDRDKAAELAVSMRAIEDTLYYAYGP